MDVRIFRPVRSVMQSGRGDAEHWVLEYEAVDPILPNSLMGWGASSDTQKQSRLFFANEKDAVAFAERHGLAWTVEHTQDRPLRLKSYADNFAHDRMIPWTH